jgi:hypothetical protein
LKSGQVYEHVYFIIDSYNDVVEFRTDDGIKAVGFNDIAKITDKKGKDITISVIGTPHDYSAVASESEGEGSITKNLEYRRPPSGNIWVAAIRFSGAYTTPFGDYYKRIFPGIGYEGDIRVALTHEFALRFLVSKTGLRLKDEPSVRFNHSDATILSHHTYFTGMRYIAAIEVYRRFNKNSNDPSTWFFYGGLGNFTNKVTVEMELQSDSTGQTWNIKDSSTDNKFILSFGAGFDKAFEPKLALEFGVGLDVEKAGSTVNESGIMGPSYAFVFDMRIGLVYYLTQ